MRSQSKPGSTRPCLFAGHRRLPQHQAALYFARAHHVQLHTHTGPRDTDTNTREQHNNNTMLQQMGVDMCATAAQSF